MRRIVALTLIVVVVVGTMGACASRKVEQVADRGLVVFKVEPSNAEVWIDGRKKGKARDFSGRTGVLDLDGGRHTLELRKEGYVTFKKELVVGGGAKQTIRVTLDPIE